MRTQTHFHLQRKTLYFQNELQTLLGDPDPGDAVKNYFFKLSPKQDLITSLTSLLLLVLYVVVCCSMLLSGGAYVVQRMTGAGSWVVISVTILHTPSEQVVSTNTAQLVSRMMMILSHTHHHAYHIILSIDYKTFSLKLLELLIYTTFHYVSIKLIMSSLQVYAPLFLIILF